MKRLATITAVIAVALTMASPAYGQSAVGDAYGGNGGGVLGTVDKGGDDGASGSGGVEGRETSSAPAPTPAASAPTQVQSVSSGSLPFTGLDLGVLAVGGIALVLVGVGIRRFARPLSSS